MLTEIQCMQIEKALTRNVEPRKIAAYLCLHMGLTVAEVSALRLRDLDTQNGTLTIRNTLARSGDAVSGKYGITPAGSERTLSLPPHVLRFLNNNLDRYSSPDTYVVSGESAVPGAHLLQNLLFSINKQYNITSKLTAIKLRNAFIRRCIESDVDLYTIGAYVGIKQIGEIQKKFAPFLSPHPMKINVLERYSAGFEPPVQAATGEVKRMNLLILGAGSQGHVVKETAEALNVFHKIAFLDDDINNVMAIDTCENYKKYVNVYPIALPSFGNCPLRAMWVARLEEAGFIMPALIHPMATVSPSAAIGAGTIVEMKAIVGTNARIQNGCIISSGAVVDVNATVCEYTHVGSAAAIKKNTVVPGCRLLRAARFMVN